LVWKPTKDALEKRRNYIANEIKIAEEARRETYLRLKEAENEKVDAHNRANFIISNATNEAYKKKDEIESQANFNAKKIRSDAETDIEKMRIKIRSDAQKQIVDIAFAAAETLVKKNYRSTDDTKIINEFIKKINEDGKNA
jgi:F-type H+-transporting ATPase subunit b